MSKEVLVLVKSWIADKKNIHSTSFRAEKVGQTKKAILLKLKGGREEWFPWSTVKSMEWAERPSGQTQKPDQHGYLNYSINNQGERST